MYQDPSQRAGELFAREGTAWRCLACAHCCLIRDGEDGRCRQRSVRNGMPVTPGGYVCGLAVDPIEKKPFYHVAPGQDTLTFGMLGCNMHCSFCQNWNSSQVGRDLQADAGFMPITASQIARIAHERGVRFLTSSYNEPTISAEWFHEILHAVEPYGIRGLMVSNGLMSAETIEFLQPHLAAVKIDLKCFNEAKYRELGGRLDAVCTSIRNIASSGIWLEVVTLVVPGWNDSIDEISAATDFLVSVSPDIPWHFSAYRPAYKCQLPPTERSTLVRIASLVKEKGMRYVYLGNIAAPSQFRDTICPQCGCICVDRSRYYGVVAWATTAGICKQCGYRVPGVWIAS